MRRALSVEAPNRFVVAVLVVGVFGLAGGCRGDARGVRAGEGRGTTSRPADDALCPEHGVLESLCTLCHPELAAVFRSHGDFCEEHGLPESFCPTCHPERGGRPAGSAPSATAEPGGAGTPERLASGAPADGTKVRLDGVDTATRAGIAVASVVEEQVTRELVVPARIAFDGRRVAEVNPPMAGLVRALRADVGTRVEVGSALAVVESAAVGGERSRLRARSAAFETAQANLERTSKLRESGITSERELAAARQEVEAARAEVRAAESSLSMAGAGREGGASYVVSSPLAGIVTERRATLGRMVGPDDVLFVVVDPSVVWAELEIPEAELTFVRAGQAIELELDALPGRSFAGPLDHVALAIEPRSRTATARVALGNAETVLRENLLGRGRIALDAPETRLVVPRSAVQRARGATLVFVRLAADTFEVRRVRVVERAGKRLAVRGRLAAGELVATEGAFLLKTETLRDSIGAGCCGAD